MRKYIVFIFLFTTSFFFAQEKGYMEGFVLDKELNNQPLAFANVKIKETKQSVTTNIDGAYAMELKSGVYTLVINFPGYKKIEIPNVIVKTGEVTSVKEIIIGALEVPLLAEAASRKEK